MFLWTDHNDLDNLAQMLDQLIHILCAQIRWGKPAPKHFNSLLSNDMIKFYQAMLENHYSIKITCKVVKLLSSIIQLMDLSEYEVNTFATKRIIANIVDLLQADENIFKNDRISDIIWTKTMLLNQVLEFIYHFWNISLYAAMSIWNETLYEELAASI